MCRYVISALLCVTWADTNISICFCPILLTNWLALQSTPLAPVVKNASALSGCPPKIKCEHWTFEQNFVVLRCVFWTLALPRYTVLNEDMWKNH